MAAQVEVLVLGSDNKTAHDRKCRTVVVLCLVLW